MKGSPEFEQFCFSSFPKSTQVVQVRCVYRSATPALTANLAANATLAKKKLKPAVLASPDCSSVRFSTF
jgi:hypothetical protein